LTVAAFAEPINETPATEQSLGLHHVPRFMPYRLPGPRLYR
jgi:hypothetical protein